MVSQQFNLFPPRTALENVTLAPMKVRGAGRVEAQQSARRLLQRVGVFDQAEKHPSQLSGGQQQRVALVREGMTVVNVTHEMNFAREVADRVIYVHKGEIVGQGTPEAVVDVPQNERTQSACAGFDAPERRRSRQIRPCRNRRGPSCWHRSSCI